LLACAVIASKKGGKEKTAEKYSGECQHGSVPIPAHRPAWVAGAVLLEPFRRPLIPPEREANPVRPVAHGAAKHYTPLAVWQQGRNAHGAEMRMAGNRAVKVPGASCGGRSPPSGSSTAPSNSRAVANREIASPQDGEDRDPPAPGVDVPTAGDPACCPPVRHCAGGLRILRLSVGMRRVSLSPVHSMGWGACGISTLYYIYCICIRKTPSSENRLAVWPFWFDLLPA
jgi:hypothetical protein